MRVFQISSSSSDDGGGGSDGCIIFIRFNVFSLVSVQQQQFTAFGGDVFLGFYDNSDDGK